MGFSRRGYWSGLPCPPPRDLPDPRMEPRSPALQTDSLPLRPFDQVAPKGLLNSSCPGKGSRGFRIGSSAPSLGNQTPSAGTQLSASKAASLLDVHMMSRVLHVRLHDRHCTDLAVIGFSYLYYDSGDCQKGFKELGRPFLSKRLFTKSPSPGSLGRSPVVHRAEQLLQLTPHPHSPDRAAGVGGSVFQTPNGPGVLEELCNS